MNQEHLHSAIEAFCADDVSTARTLLRQYVAENPGDEKGWFWMSRVAEQPGEKHAYLRHMLDLRSSDD